MSLPEKQSQEKDSRRKEQLLQRPEACVKNGKKDKYLHAFQDWAQEKFHKKEEERVSLTDPEI